MVKVEDFYVERIRDLPAVERLRQAALILNDIPPESLVDYRDAWSDEDLSDLRAAGLRALDAALGEQDNA